MNEAHEQVGQVDAEADVGDKRRARDGRHGASHDAKELGLCHRLDVARDEQLRFHLAEEDLSAGGECFSTTDAHRFAQRPTETLHDLLQDAEVVEQVGERADKDNGTADDEREDEFRLREFFTGYECDSISSGIQKALNTVAERVEDASDEGHPSGSGRQRRPGWRCLSRPDAN